ncbi:MAG: hypothetical protein DVB22_002589 [Verrucomicrobia bacterium]|nr:MAG: hypothetical protein DVB22_002589 [Verrucomicrobiota bacterium]
MESIRQDIREAALRVQAGLSPTAAYTTPSNYEVGLLTESGAEVSTSGTGYARRTISSTGFFAVGDSPLGNKWVTNTGTIRFPASGSATLSWGAIKHVALWKTGESEPLFIFSRDDSESVLTGGSYTVAPDDLQLLDNII